MTGQIVVRPARAQDAPALSVLLEQLGYPAQANDVRGRLERILAGPDMGVLVAETSGDLVGLASYQVFELIYRPAPECRLTALVVDSGHRRRGVASTLVEAIAAMARGRGCFRLELNTKQGRAEALPFYTALGFTERRHRLVKALKEDEAEYRRGIGCCPGLGARDD